PAGKTQRKCSRVSRYRDSSRCTGKSFEIQVNVMRSMYSKRFFATYENGSRISAQEMLPFVFSLVAHDAVVDVGCGKGTWLLAATEPCAKRAIGFDGQYLDKSILPIDESEFRAADLKAPIQFDG